MLRSFFLVCAGAVGLVLAGCSTSDPLVAQIARDTINAENLDQYEFVSLSGGQIRYRLSTGDEVRFPQLSGISFDSQKDCPRINAAVSAILDADFPDGDSQPQDFALARVLLILAQAKDAADC